MAASALFLDGVRAVSRGLLDVLMPPACIACKAPVATPLRFCGDCWAGLSGPAGSRCVQCAVPLPIEWQAETHCLGCLRDPPHFDRTSAPCLYEGPARAALLAFKNGREAYAAPLAAAMHRAAQGFLAAGTLVVPVPLHRWRLAERGYNQALLLARVLAAENGAELAPSLLRRVKATPSSKGLNRAQRRRNVIGAFRLEPGARDRLQGRHVVLVDDVMTSGATANAGAGLLKRNGAARVDVLVYARVAAVDATSYVAASRSQETDGQDRDLHQVPLPLLYAGQAAAAVQGR